MKSKLAVLMLGVVLAGCGSGKNSPSEEEVPISLVYLLRQPRALTLAETRVAADRAFGRQFTADPEAENRIQPDNPPGSFTIKTRQFRLHIVNVAEPYGQPQQAKGGTLVDKAFRDHRACLLVEWETEGDAANVDGAFRTLGKLAAELAGDDCLALYCPRTGQMITYGNDLLPALRSDRPLNAFLVERK